MKLGMKTAGMMLAASLAAASASANDEATFMMVPTVPGDTDPMVAYVPASGKKLLEYLAQQKEDNSGVCGEATIEIGTTIYPDGPVADVTAYQYAVNKGPFQHKINTLYKNARVDTQFTLTKMIFTGYGYNQATGEWDRPKCAGPQTIEKAYRRYEYMYFTCEFEDTHTIRVDAEHNWQPYCGARSQ